MDNKLTLTLGIGVAVLAGWVLSSTRSSTRKQALLRSELNKKQQALANEYKRYHLLQQEYTQLINFVFQKKPKQLEVAYWTIRGLGAPCRMMVMAAGVELVATCYDVKPLADGGFDRSPYMTVRPELRKSNALANLPYCVDEEGNMITQTNAVLSYLGTRLNMLGDSNLEKAQCDQLLCEAMDLRNSMTRIAYSVGDQSAKCQALIDEQITNGSLMKFEKWLHAKTGSRVYFVGSRLSAPDFHIWEMLDQYNAMGQYHALESVLERLPLLQTFYRHFAALPENANYFASKLARLPFNQKMAKFGATKSMGVWEQGSEYDFANVTGKY